MLQNRPFSNKCLHCIVGSLRGQARQMLLQLVLGIIVMAKFEGNAVPQLQEVITYEAFLNWKVPQLTIYLKSHAINQSSNKSTLAKKAFDVWRVGLSVENTVKEDKAAIRKTQKNKLKIKGGLIQLPDPKTLLVGWKKSFQGMPEVQ